LKRPTESKKCFEEGAKKSPKAEKTESCWTKNVYTHNVRQVFYRNDSIYKNGNMQLQPDVGQREYNIYKRQKISLVWRLYSFWKDKVRRSIS
jgi:hypothetical protein